MKKLKYIEGEVVYTKYGRGTVVKIDPKDKRWTYFVHCDDGTDMWCHENDLSSFPIPVVKEAEPKAESEE